MIRLTLETYPEGSTILGLRAGESALAVYDVTSNPFILDIRTGNATDLKVEAERLYSGVAVEERRAK